MSLLKPLAGTEPLLEEALKSFCGQDYPDLQIIFGVQNPKDPAIKIVQRLQKQFPEREITLIIAPKSQAPNQKIANLIHMLPHAKHELLVISDSDIHAPHNNFLKELAIALQQKTVGLVISLYGGLPVHSNLVQRLGSMHINYTFLPGVLMSRFLGRQDCLGATIALRRQVLETIGGLESLLPHLADDAILGRQIRTKGLNIVLAPSIVKTTVSDPSLSALYAHELRWNRTVKALEPVGFVFSFLQFPIFWSSILVLCNPLNWLSWLFFICCWAIKGQCNGMINKQLKLDSCSNFSLLPCRDWLSVLIMMNSFIGKTVNWRGQIMKVGKHPKFFTSSPQSKN